MDDLKLIKRQYGEEMSHLCRELFPTLLETPGLLYRTLTSKFAPSRLLYKDIKEQKLEDIFKTIIYHTADNSENIEVNKTPVELLKEQGYTLYKCETEKDIQSFRHYYKRKDEKNEAFKTSVRRPGPLDRAIPRSLRRRSSFRRRYHCCIRRYHRRYQHNYRPCRCNYPSTCRCHACL